MDLNQLKAFVTVAETGNLTKASEQLFLSQPAVSAQLKALESELGVVLFHRTARGMTLTVAGQVLKQDAAHALGAAKHVFSRAQSFRQGLSGPCRIGTISEPVILRLSELLTDLMLANANLSMQLTQSVSGIVIEQILEGKLDGGFVIGDIGETRIGTIPICPITLRIVAPYEWRDRVLNADWEDIAKLPWIATSPKCSFHQIAMGMFGRHQLSPNSVVALDQETTLRRLVSSGVGLSLMREDMALDAETRKEAVIWPKAAETKPLNFIFRQFEANTPLIQALCKSVRSVWQLEEYKAS